MTGELYDRRVTLTLTPRLAGDQLVIPHAGPNDLRVAFDILKTVQSQSNKATIDIYNLAQSTRDRLHTAGDVLTIEAGYVDLVEQLYEGQITKGSSGRSGADFVTTLECGDGDDTFSTQTVEQNFRAGERVRDVIKRVAAEFTKPIPDPDDAVKFGPPPPKNKKKTIPSRIQFRSIDADLSALEVDLLDAGFSIVLRRAFSVAGNAAEVMDKLARMWRFDWSVQDGVFQLASYGRALVGESVRLTPETGLLGSPLKTDDGCQFVALLIPQIRPGVLVTIESATLTGSFRCESVRYLGDTHGDNWIVEGEARSLGTT